MLIWGNILSNTSVVRRKLNVLFLVWGPSNPRREKQRIQIIPSLELKRTNEQRKVETREIRISSVA